MHKRFVILSGCSGGGRSTLLTELARRGHAVVEEPGRRIVAEERASGGVALPWIDLSAFARRAVAMAWSDIAAAARQAEWVFFDRGLVDAAVALQHTDGIPIGTTIGDTQFHPTVFLAPPWPEIHRADADRRHGFEEACAEYDRLLAAWRALGYRLAILPRVSPQARADHLLAALPNPPA
jgi:predicted ATPase